MEQCIPFSKKSLLPQYLSGLSLIFFYVSIIGVNARLSLIARRHHLQIQALQIGHNGDGVGPNNLPGQKVIKSVRVLLTIVMVLLISWTPIMILNVLSVNRSISSRIPSIIKELCMWLFYSNSFMNCLVYVAKSPDFRKALRKVLTSRLGIGQPGDSTDTGI